MPNEILIPNSFEKLLREDESIHNLIYRSKLILERIIKEYHCFFFPEYTNHGILHINQLLNKVESIIHEDAYKSLDPKNIGIMIVSCFLHDVGMNLGIAHFNKMIESSEIICTWDTKSFQELWYDYKLESLKWTTEQRINIIGSNINPTHRETYCNEDLSYIDKKYIGEFIRRNHPRISHEILVDGFYISKNEKLTILETDNLNFSYGGIQLNHNLLNISGFISRSHGIDLRKAISYFKHLDSHNWMDYLGIKTVFLMSLLRVADYLLIDSNRVFASVLQFRDFSSPYSINEFKKHFAIINSSNSRLDKESMRFLVDEKIANQEYQSIKKLFIQIQNELDLVWAILSEAYGFYSDLSNLKLTIRRISSNILEENFGIESNTVYGDIKLDFTPNLLPLLSRKLYTHKVSAVRELIQNSVDACTIRKEEEEDTYSPMITVNLNENSLVVKDNGIGMDYHDINQYLLKVGRSSKIKKYNLDGIVGQFGIGILSVFNIGNECTIITRKLGDPFSYKLSLNENNDLTKNLDVQKTKSNTPFGTEILIRLLPGMVEQITNSINQYFHYNGNIKVRSNSALDFFDYFLLWRTIDINGYKFKWNYRYANRLKEGLFVESNYLNGFLVKEFAIITSSGQKLDNIFSHIIVDYFDNSKDVSINLSREKASIRIDEILFNKLFEDISLDYYIYLLTTNKQSIINGVSLYYPFKTENFLDEVFLLFNKGFCHIKDAPKIPNLVVVHITRLEFTEVRDILGILPDNIALIHSRNETIESIYTGSPSHIDTSELYQKHMKYIDRIGKDNIISLNKLNDIYNSDIEITTTSCPVDFKNKLIPFKRDKKNILFDEFINNHKQRYLEIERIKRILEKKYP